MYQYKYPGDVYGQGFKEEGTFTKTQIFQRTKNVLT